MKCSYKPLFWNIATNNCNNVYEKILHWYQSHLNRFENENFCFKLKLGLIKISVILFRLAILQYCTLQTTSTLVSVGWNKCSNILHLVGGSLVLWGLTERPVSSVTILVILCNYDTMTMTLWCNYSNLTMAVSPGHRRLLYLWGHTLYSPRALARNTAEKITFYNCGGQI